MEVFALELVDMSRKLGLSKYSIIKKSTLNDRIISTRSSVFAANTTFGIAVMSEDEAGNKSPVSNIIQVRRKKNASHPLNGFSMIFV